MNEKELKIILTQYKNSNFQSLGTVDVGTLTNAMLHHIGSTDPELRDHLIYPSFTNLIINNYYPRPELNRIMNICLDERHLFYRICEADEDAIFTRAFSSLIIAVLLHVNRQNSFLAEEEIDRVAVRLVDYVSREEDVRGYVEEKGWAHSIAHIADALDELVKQPQLSNARLKEITFTKQNFISGNKEYFMQRTNFKQFLRSLLLHLEVINKQEELRTHLKQALISINQPYYNI